MSQATTQTLPCPDCGRSQPFTLWSTVNAATDPELRERCLNGDLFLFRCQQCDATARVEYPLLYQDPERAAMVWLTDPPSDEALAGNATPPEVEGLVEAELRPRYRFRIAHSHNELIEKAGVFEDGLDDRFVEALKLFLWRQIAGDDPPDAEYLLYDGVAEDGSGALLFVRFNAEGQPQRFTAGWRDEPMLQDLHAYVKGLPEAGQWTRVGHDTGLEIVREWSARVDGRRGR